MPMMSATVRFQVFCKCGTPLEQIWTGKNEENYITVKPCAACCQVRKIEQAIEEKQISRRGVMVSERAS